MADREITTIPNGPLGIIALPGCEEMAEKIDRYLVKWRKQQDSEHKTTIAFSGYERDTYILNATFLAMKRAVEGLSIKPDFAYIDGNQYPKIPFVAEETVVKGDAKSMSIAAASILAKVSRDRFMLEIAEKYPEYCFEKHKGYGTKLHYEMIEKYGVSPVHRRSFLKFLDNE